MKKLILSLAGAAFVAALAINLTLNKADVLAQNKLMLENIEAVTAAETREEAKKACTNTIGSCAVVAYYPDGSTIHRFYDVYGYASFTLNY